MKNLKNKMEKDNAKLKDNRSTLRIFLRLPASKRGFVLPFSVLIAGVLLAIGLAIFSITLKELILSSGGRESQFAFYAADTGGECALYWDIRHGGFSSSIFATSSDSALLSYDSGTDSPIALCNNENIINPATGWSPTGWTISTPGTYEGTQYQAVTVFDMNFDNGSCATVTVMKDNGTTRIDSRGYNTCDANNSRRVERGLRIRY